MCLFICHPHWLRIYSFQLHRERTSQHSCRNLMLLSRNTDLEDSSPLCWHAVRRPFRHKLSPRWEGETSERGKRGFLQHPCHVRWPQWRKWMWVPLWKHWGTIFSPDNSKDKWDSPLANVDGCVINFTNISCAEVKRGADVFHCLGG